MKRIVLEVDGVRHALAKNGRPFEDYCEKEKCSLYSFCPRSPGAPCVIIAPTGYHFEQAPSDSQRGGTEGDNREIIGR